MKKTLILLLSLLLCISLCLGSCNDGGEDAALTDETTETTKAQTTTEATTKKPKKTTVKTTTQKDPENDHPDLGPEILAENEIVSRLTEGNGITVDIYNGQTIELNYHGWPTVCKGEDGTLYASASLRISHIDPFGAVVFYESHDNGETWSEPRIIADTVLDDRDSGVIYLGDGKILVNWFSHNASNYLQNPDYVGWMQKVTVQQALAVQNRWQDSDPSELLGGSFVILSEDGGKTWGEPVRVPVKAPHGMTLAQDGKTLQFFGVPSANWHLSGATGLQSGYAYLFTSTDCGKTWTQKGSVMLPTDLGENTFYDEGYCIQLKDGSYLAAVRVERSDFGHWTICVTRSADGVTWEYPEVMASSYVDVVSGSPPHLLQLSSGVVLVSYSCRNGKSCGSRGRLSFDGGKTWGEEFIICISAQPKNGDLGYPSTVELSDGTLLTTYYQAYGKDPHPSLLYTKWRLVEEGE